jgi:hypothetical protein
MLHKESNSVTGTVNAYGIRKVPGLCLSAGTLVRNCGAKTCGACSEIPIPPLVEEETPFSNTLATNKNLFMDPKGTRNLERLWWRGPATIYCHAMLCSGPFSLVNEAFIYFSKQGK